MEYPKIHSLWKREGHDFDITKAKPKGGKIIPGEYANEAFGNIKNWRVDEKVDGTNIRIIYEHGKVKFGGRTKDAQIPCHLLDYLQAMFTETLFYKAFQKDNENFAFVVIFGEGYGPKIQACGGNYRKEVSFICFDIFVNGWWLKKDKIKEICAQFNIDVVPDLGIMTEEGIIEFVKSKPLSQCSMNPQMMEGVVCRPEPMMLHRNGQPIMFKLKCKEF